MSQVFLHTDARRNLTRLQKEVLDTLSIENRIPKSPALRRCVVDTVEALANAGIEDVRELTRIALIVGRRFLKEFDPLAGGNANEVSA